MAGNHPRPIAPLLRLSGEDVRGFLQGLVTNDIDAGAAAALGGAADRAGQGLFDFILWADGADVLIDCEAEEAEALARRLTLYRLRRAIAIARDDGLAVHWAPDGDRACPTRASPRSAAAGSRPPAAPPQGWLAHRLRSA